MNGYRGARFTESLLIPLAAMGVGTALFGIFCAVLGSNPFAVFHSIYRAAFADWYSWQNTLDPCRSVDAVRPVYRSARARRTDRNWQ